LAAAGALGVAAFVLYWTTLVFGVDEASDGWSFGPPLLHPWRYGIAVALALSASGLLLAGLPGLLTLLRPGPGAKVGRVGVWIAIVGAVALVVAGAFQAYLVVLAATTPDVAELILRKNRFELLYLVALLGAMTGLGLGFVLAVCGLARARLVSPWPALAIGVSSFAVVIVSLYAIPAAAASLIWLAVELARRGSSASDAGRSRGPRAA
jgi:hypothetical protein